MPPLARSATTPPRLILLDDHQMVVEALRASLSEDYDVVGTAHSGVELLDLLKRCSADCVLLDLQLPGKNGLDLIPAIRRLQPSLKIIVVTMFVDRCLADAAISAGAHGFVPKDAQLAELRTAIGEVLDARHYVSHRVPKASHRLGLSASHVGLNRLTPRQQEIVLLLGEGKQAFEIAEQLHVQPSTITFHKHNIMRVLGVDTGGSLVRFAVLVRAGTLDTASVTPVRGHG